MKPRIFLLLFALLIVLFQHQFFAQTTDTRFPRPIQIGGKWGFVDGTGKIVIKPQFYWVEEFSEGLAAFESDLGYHGYIDLNGKIVVEAKFDRAEPFSEGFAPVAKEFTWGYIDKKGKIVIPLQYQYAHGFTDGYAPVVQFQSETQAEKNIFNVVSFIDKTGKILLGPIESVFNPRTSNGIAFIDISYPVGESPPSKLVNMKGETIIVVEDFDYGGFSEGLAPVKVGGKWGYVDTSGSFVIKPRFDGAKSFYEGLAAVLIGDRWGYIDTKGKLKIKPKYELENRGIEGEFSDGLALAIVDEEYLFINQRGEIVFKPDYKFSKVKDFKHGLAAVRIGEGDAEKRAYIDRAGKIIAGPYDFRYKTAEDIKAQINRKEAKEGKKNEVEPRPLLDKYKKLNIHELIRMQPDFQADLGYFRSETVSGGGGGYRIARKGKRYRKASNFWIFLGKGDESRIRLFPDSKRYDDLEGVENESVSFSGPFDVRTLANEPGVRFEVLGMQKLGKHDCIKVQAFRSGEEHKGEEIFLYLAPDLNFLAIAAQTSKGRFSMVQRLENISLDVQDELVNIPPDYKRVPKDKWMKVKGATVKYDGAINKGAGVFRSPGGELFVWIKDHESSFVSTYLIRPKERVFSVAYQGMLRNTKGEFIWVTSNIVAFSNTGYRGQPAIESSIKEDKIITTSANSISFLDLVRVEIIIPKTKAQ